jgi:hypothetical protein
MQLIPLRRQLYHRGRLAFTPDGRYLGVEANPFTLFDTLGGEPPRELPGAFFEMGYRFVRGGRAVASIADYNKLAAQDLGTGEVVTRTIDFRAEDLAAGPTGAALYAGGRPHGLIHDEIHVLDAETLAPKGGFLWRVGKVDRLIVSADERWLAGHDNYRLQVVGLPGGQRPVQFIAPGFIGDFGLAADGSRLAVGTPRGLIVWETASGKEVVRSGKHRRGVTAVAWAPDRPILATGDNGGLVFFWDAAGRVLKQYEWRLTKVDGLAFSPDGLRCAAAGGGLGHATVVVWDVDV